MSTHASLPTFECEDCGSVSIEIVGPMHDLAPVRCCGCGRELGPWDLFADDLHRRLAEHGVVRSRRGAPGQVFDPN